MTVGRSVNASTSAALDHVNQSQLDSLDDTEPLAEVWKEVRSKIGQDGKFHWGGRGMGGRGTSRRTYQPKDIVLDNVNLTYSSTGMAKSKTLLEDASLKLLSQSTTSDGLEPPSPNIYALQGRNGSGKSSLLKRMFDGSIPGFPSHISMLYLPQELSVEDEGELTIHQYLKARMVEHSQLSSKAMQHSIEDLEDMIDVLDLTLDEDQERMESLNEEIARCEEELQAQEKEQTYLESRIVEALEYMGIPDHLAQDRDLPLSTLSPGLKKKVVLSTVLLCPCELLLADEPSAHLDILGLVQLRRLLLEQKSRGSKTSMILLVSHDLDLVNEVATHIIELRNYQLYYYTGNYIDFMKQRHNDTLSHFRHELNVHKKKETVLGTIQHLKEQGPSKRKGAAKKKQRQINSQRKKLERIENDEKEIPSDVGGLTGNELKRTKEQLLQDDTGLGNQSAPDKDIQFVFRDPKSEWGEPLILAYDIGLALSEECISIFPSLPPISDLEDVSTIRKKDGFLFDSVDICVEEHQKYCIFGKNGSAKSQLLRVLAGLEKPTEGAVKHALNIDIAMVPQLLVDGMVEAGIRNGTTNALSFLSTLYPKKSEHEIRGELTNFGLGPAQASTSLRFLSGGERTRLSLAAVMLRDPQILIMDNPTLNLDLEAVEALIYGLSRWKGTLIFVSHDTHFVRSLDPTCFVLMEEEGKLRQIVGENPVDTYLRSFATRHINHT